MTRVLILEPEKLQREGFQDLFREHGYEVEVASNHSETMRWIEWQHFDCAIIDLGTHPDELTILERIRLVDPVTIILVMSAYGSVESAVNAMRMGAYDYIQKPFLLDELETLTSQALDEQRKLPHALAQSTEGDEEPEVGSQSPTQSIGGQTGKQGHSLTPVHPQGLSHYDLLERIGEGGMGVVWKANDKRLDRTVAIKLLPVDLFREPRQKRILLREAKLAAAVNDSHIVQIYDFDRAGDLDFIVMEYVDGKSLNKILNGSPLPPTNVVDVGLQVARALGKAHQKGILHRDLKPGNIMVALDGEVKVMDFGLSLPIEKPVASMGSSESRVGSKDVTLPPGCRPEGHTWGSALVGTVPYMSPEQVRQEVLDGCSDIFSLGVVLYEMATGRRPFEGETSEHVLAEILRGQPRGVSELAPDTPPELERIIKKAMAPKAEARYQKMEDLIADLKRLGVDLGSTVNGSV